MPPVRIVGRVRTKLSYHTWRTAAIAAWQQNRTFLETDETRRAALSLWDKLGATASNVDKLLENPAKDVAPRFC